MDGMINSVDIENRRKIKRLKGKSTNYFYDQTLICIKPLQLYNLSNLRYLRLNWIAQHFSLF